MTRDNKDLKQNKHANDSDNISSNSRSGEPSGTGQNYSVGTSSKAEDKYRGNTGSGKSSSPGAVGKTNSDDN